MRKKITSVFKWLIIIWLALLTLFFTLFKRIDFSSLESHDFYKDNFKLINQLNIPALENGEGRAGWASQNITPDFPCTSAGYGDRWNYDKILDSIYVRSVVFEMGKQRFLYLSYDLLMIHPFLCESLEKKLLDDGIRFDQIFYTATHTHNSVGGYGKGFASRLALGPSNEKVMNLLVNQTIKAINIAVSKIQKVEIATSNLKTEKLVVNRVMPRSGKVDTTLSVIHLKNSENKVAVMISFPAHANNYSRKVNSISADFPGNLVQKLEKDERIDFAIYSAGSVGSHGTTIKEYGKTHIDIYTDSLKSLISKNLDQIRYFPLKEMRGFEYEMPLPKTAMKLNYTGWAVRDLAFRALVGKPIGKLTFLQLNETILIGTPCDFSGEYRMMLQEKIKDKNLIINSFNGQYLGYIIKDEYYTQDMHEARDQGWMGPYSGRYFTETIVEIIKKMER